MNIQRIFRKYPNLWLLLSVFLPVRWRLLFIGSNIDLCDLCDKEKRRPFAIQKIKKRHFGKTHLLHCYPVLI